MDRASAADRQEIRELIDNWVVWRDAGLWDRFATLWHPRGRMIATWFQADAADFIARSRLAFEAGSKVMHSLGGSSIDVAGDRAVAQTRMEILQRGTIDSVDVEVVCRGRFFDFLERWEDRWTLRLRQPIYELDRMTTVAPGVPAPRLDAEVLRSFPEGYAHLACLQTRMGFDVARDLPGARGEAVEALYARGEAWLAGAPEP